MPLIASTDRPQPVPAAPAADISQLVELLPRDALPSIVAPQFEAAATRPAVTDMKPNERVIGLVINGDARAYPLSILSNHEIVNDVVGGRTGGHHVVSTLLYSVGL